MKKVLVFITIVLITSVSAKADYTKVINGIMLIGSDSRSFNYKTPYNDSGTISYNLELYTDGNDKQYSLVFEFGKDKTCPMIPTFGTILLKTGREEVIELHALYVYDQYDTKETGKGYFPISDEQLEKIINDGIIKIRVQMIAGDDHHPSYAEKEWKKRKKVNKEPYSLSNDSRVPYRVSSNATGEELGSSLRDMHVSIKKKCEKNISKYLESQRSFDSAF